MLWESIVLSVLSSEAAPGFNAVSDLASILCEDLEDEQFLKMKPDDMHKRAAAATARSPLLSLDVSGCFIIKYQYGVKADD